MGSRDDFGVSNIDVNDVWNRLKSNTDAVLIDVRTRAEWAFVGLPDLSEAGKRVLTIEWQTFPDNRTDPSFSDRLREMLAAAQVKNDTELFFICRSGGRSRMAAEAMAAAGYSSCWNVAEGFEGPLDDNRHRGRIAGWKAAGLPWVQG